MKFLAFVFLVLGTVGSPAATVSVRRAAYYCSYGRLSQYYSPHSTRFIATATSDSVRTRPRVRSQIRKWANGVREPPYVQIFRVERLSNRVDPSLLQSMKESRNRIVIVPWGYESDCHTLSWRGSALWAKPDRSGLFGVGLRPRTEWIGGIPTFDTTPDGDTPYPGPSAANSAVNLNAGEFLSLVDSVPAIPVGLDEVRTYVQMKKRFEAIFRWAAAHPQQAKRMPLSQWVESGKDWIARAQFDTVISPFAGTYRFVLKVPPGDTVVFYGRTGLRTYDVIWQEAGDTTKRAKSDPLGYYLIVGIGKTVEGLADAWPGQNDSGVMGAGFRPIVTAKDSTVWKGDIDVFLSLQKLAADSSLATKLAHIRKVDTDNMDMRARSYLPGRIVRRRNGALEINLLVKERDSTIATIRGMRISKTTFTHSR